MKVEIYTSYNYGVWNLSYRKTFDLPFVPFIGLRLCFDSKNDYYVNLDNNNFCRTMIDFDVESQTFVVDVRNVWKNPVSDESIDCVVEQFSSWDSTHTTKIDELKELMQRNYNSQNTTGNVSQNSLT
jgi:hypothetical protein